MADVILLSRFSDEEQNVSKPSSFYYKLVQLTYSCYFFFLIINFSGQMKIFVYYCIVPKIID